MRKYLNQSGELPLTDGNVFTTVDYGMATHGGFACRASRKRTEIYRGGFAGGACGWGLVIQEIAFKIIFI